MSRPLTVVDIGGTHLRWASWSPEGGLRDRHSLPSPSFRRRPDFSVAQLKAQLVKVICDVVPRQLGMVVGVSFGAAMNQLDGTAYASAPLWGAHEEPFDLRGALYGRRPEADWHVINDVMAALLSVVASPLCAKDRKVMLVTISTGIAARTMDCRTLRVPFDGSGLQGEIGHLPTTVNLRGETVLLTCECGQPGHLSAYASGPGIARMANTFRERHSHDWNKSVLGCQLAQGVPIEDAFGLALGERDGVAAELLEAVTAPIAAILRTALCLDPDLDHIVLTGGVASSMGSLYRAAILEHLDADGLYLTSKYTPHWIADRIVIGEAECLEGAGIAALRAIQ